MLFRQGKPYSQDLRERVFAAADDGGRVGQMARLLRVSVSYVSKVLSRRRESGETTARPQRCHVAPKLAELYGAIREQVTARPDATLAELRAWLFETHGVSASEALLCTTLAELGLTLKKSRCGRRNRTAPMSRRRAPNGARTRPISLPASWCSSTKPRIKSGAGSGPRPI
jgi:transposase